MNKTPPNTSACLMSGPVIYPFVYYRIAGQNALRCSMPHTIEEDPVYHEASYTHIKALFSRALIMTDRQLHE